MEWGGAWGLAGRQPGNLEIGASASSPSDLHVRPLVMDGPAPGSGEGQSVGALGFPPWSTSDGHVGEEQPLPGLHGLPSHLRGEVGCKHPLRVPRHGHEAPLAAGCVEPAQQELPEPQHRLDGAEHRLRRVLALGVEGAAF